ARRTVRDHDGRRGRGPGPADPPARLRPQRVDDRRQPGGTGRGGQSAAGPRPPARARLGWAHDCDDALPPAAPARRGGRARAVHRRPPRRHGYGASAAVAAWTAAGIEVSYLLLTRGEAGMAEDPATVGPLRETEQRRACARVGVSDL